MFKKEIKYWIITDTHFGHDMLIEKKYRPEKFEQIILNQILYEDSFTSAPLMSVNDVMIHLGDVCIGEDEKWHKLFLQDIRAKKILVRGNHDSKSDSWYYEHGWDFVCDSFTLEKYGKKILFSHEPIAGHELDLNIHGHWHNNDHRIEPEFKNWYNDKYKLISLENSNYKPIQLKSLIK